MEEEEEISEVEVDTQAPRAESSKLKQNYDISAKLTSNFGMKNEFEK